MTSDRELIERTYFELQASHADAVDDLNAATHAQAEADARVKRAREILHDVSVALAPFESQMEAYRTVDEHLAKGLMTKEQAEIRARGNAAVDFLQGKDQE